MLHFRLLARLCKPRAALLMPLALLSDETHEAHLSWSAMGKTMTRDSVADQFDLKEGLMAGKHRVAEEFERKYILFALGTYCGNVTRAARVADMDRSNFHRLMRKHGVESEGFRTDDES